MLKDTKEKVKVTFAKTTVKKVREKTCVYKDCGKKFIGYANAKYCPFHKDPKNREVVKKVEEVKESEIFRFPYDVDKKTIIERQCDCCGVSYKLPIFPLMRDYPRFCDNHRNVYRRKFYREQQAKGVR